MNKQIQKICLEQIEISKFRKSPELQSAAEFFKLNNHRQFNKIYKEELDRILNEIPPSDEDNFYTYCKEYLEIFQRHLEKEKLISAIRSQKKNAEPSVVEYKMARYYSSIYPHLRPAAIQLTEKNYSLCNISYYNGRAQAVILYDLDVKTPNTLRYKNEVIRIKTGEDKQGRTILCLIPPPQKTYYTEEWKHIWEEFVNLLPVKENVGRRSPNKEPEHVAFWKKFK